MGDWGRGSQDPRTPNALRISVPSWHYHGQKGSHTPITHRSTIFRRRTQRDGKETRNATQITNTDKTAHKHALSSHCWLHSMCQDGPWNTRMWLKARGSNVIPAAMLGGVQFDVGCECLCQLHQSLEGCAVTPRPCGPRRLKVWLPITLPAVATIWRIQSSATLEPTLPHGQRYGSARRDGDQYHSDGQRLQRPGGARRLLPR